MKQWEKNNNIETKDKKSYKRFKKSKILSRSRKSHHIATSNTNDNNHSNSHGRTEMNDFDPYNSSLFRYYNIQRGKKRKLDNVPSLNNYHLTDWILYTSSNFLHGGHWTNYISTFNFSLLTYYNSLEFYNFYRKFLFLDFSLSYLGLDTNTGHIRDHR
jgi:hypothetical protein